MTLLLDTQVVVWSVIEPDRVPARTRAAITNEAQGVLMSAVVFWEIAIKLSLGKISIREDLPTHVRSWGFVALPVTDVHAWAVRGLPPHHRDPFDRLLVAQALVEGATLVTADPALARYDVPVLWG